MPINKKLEVLTLQAGQRLDIFCTSRLPDHSRAAVQRAIKGGQITVNDKQVKPSYLVQTGDSIRISLPDTRQPVSIAPSPKMSLPIIYEDRDIVVVNKPAGIATHPTYHPGGGKWMSKEKTVALWFVNRYPEAKGVGENMARCGIVHRLDKDTSGVLILAKNQDTFNHLKQQFKKRRLKKEYLALVYGTPKATDGRINQPLIRSRRNPLRRTILHLATGSGYERRTLNDSSAKTAITEWRLVKKFSDKYALLKVFPYTGRTHQIRVHLHFIGHPIVGDPLYTFKRRHPPPGVIRQLLHAEKLTITLPSGKRRTFTAELPSDFSGVLENLRQETSPTEQTTERHLGFRTPSSFQGRKRHSRAHDLPAV